MKFTFKQRLLAVISCYVLVMSACVVGLVAISNSSQAAPLSGWSERSRALGSSFYERYYTNGVFQRANAINNVVEVGTANDLGCVSFLSHQPSAPDKPNDPPKNNFNNITIRLTKDIDLSQNMWTPIAPDFRGNIDGNGYRITGMKSFVQKEEERPRFYAFEGTGNNTLVMTQNINAAFIAGVLGFVEISNLTIEGDIKTSSIKIDKEDVKPITGWKTDANTTYQIDNPDIDVSLWGRKTGANLLVSDQVEGAIDPTHVVKNVSQTTIPVANIDIRKAWTVAGFVNDISPNTKLVFRNCISKVNISHGFVSYEGATPDTSNAFGFLSSASADSMNVSDLPSDLGLRDAIAKAQVGVFFDECINYGNFNMHKPLLGAAGLAATATIVNNSANHGNISVSSGSVGGLVIGSNERDLYIRYSYNEGTLTLANSDGGGVVGGIAVGHLRASVGGANIIIRDCSNYGILRSTATENTAVGGILAQYYSAQETGKLTIENCLNLGDLDVRNGRTIYRAGIVARIMGNGLADIQVVYTSAVEADGTRGGAIVDDLEKGVITKATIKGAVQGVGGSAGVISSASKGTNNVQGIFNYGVVTDSRTGTVSWAPFGDTDTYINNTIDDDFLAYGLGGTGYMVENFSDPNERGLMEKLRSLYLSTGPNATGQHYRSWFKSEKLGNGSMYLTMSKLTIAEYNFNGSWQSWEIADKNAQVSHTFKHNIKNKPDQDEWTFIGFDTTNADNVVSIRRSEDMTTTIMAFGDRVRLYEKWSLAVKSITYKYPDSENWEEDAGYADFVNNSQNIESLNDYTQGENYILYRPTVTGYPNLKFQGWYDSSRNLVTQITFDMLGEIVLYGIFREAKYEIIYDTYHGRFTSSAPNIPPTLIDQLAISRGTVYYLDDYPTPRRSLYEFAGWYYDSDYSGDRVETINCAQVTSNIYLYAAWIDPETGQLIDYEKMEPEKPLGFFGWIMLKLEQVFGDATIGLIIIGATLIMLVVLIRLFSGRKKSTGGQSQNATQILTELLIKQQVAAAGVNAIPGQMPMGAPMMGGPMMGGQFPGQYAPPPPPPPPMMGGGFSPSSVAGFGGGMPPPPPPPTFDMGEPPPFVDIPKFDSSAFDDMPPPPPPPDPFM